MNIGIVKSWNQEKKAGTVTSDSNEYDFTYGQGQSVANYQGEFEPRLSGGSVTREPFAHKIPRIGDPVIFHATPEQKIVRWGYACHYVTAAERSFGTEFRSN